MSSGPGEPYAQMLVVPTDLQYRAKPMDESLPADRAKQDRQTYQLGHRLATECRAAMVIVAFDEEQFSITRSRHRHE
jgi:hypothetical protein